MVTIEYRRARAADRGPFPKEWLAALSRTGRFYRSAQRGQILFLVENGPPPEFVTIGRREELRSVLEGADFLSITGDELTLDDWAGLWFNLSDNRWRLPSSARAFANSSAPAAQAVRS